jgi:hypothetical protein
LKGATLEAVYHFTTLPALKMIMSSGALRPSGCESEMEKDQRTPVLWFTEVRESYESTALKFGFMDIKAQSSCITCVRIAVPASLAPLTWMDYIRVSNLRRSIMAAYEHAALMTGSNVNNFRASLHPVPTSEFLDVHVWKGGQWKQHTNDALTPFEERFLQQHREEWELGQAWLKGR